MATVLLHRPAREPAPPVPTQELVVATPPGEPDETPTSPWLTTMLPLAGSLGGLLFALARPQPVYIAAAATMAVLSIGISVISTLAGREAAARRTATGDARYRDHVDQVADRAAAVADAQRQAAVHTHPDLAELSRVAQARLRLWERRPGDTDAWQARIGVGSVPLATPIRLELPTDPLVRLSPALWEAAATMVTEHATVPDMPITVDLAAVSSLVLVGPSPVIRQAARALICDLATWLSPDDLRIVVHTPAEVTDWEWVKWLPHADPTAGGGLVDSLAELADRLTPPAGGDAAAGGRLLVVVDGYRAGSDLSRLAALSSCLTDPQPARPVTVVVLCPSRADEPPAVDVHVQVDAQSRFEVRPSAGGSMSGSITGAVQAAPLDRCELLARLLAPLRLRERSSERRLAATTSLIELLGLARAADIDPARTWALLQREQVLRLPLGVDADGQPLLLDLKEAARGGMGPHGLLVGATGSGKSELLRSLVAGLAITHPPEVVNFALVDFKGGAAFAGLSQLPHVAGAITNLADELGLVDRMYQALVGEQQRRQLLLRDAGNLDTIASYQELWAAGRLEGRPALPYLIIVVDEFGELLEARPEFVDLFGQIGRVGRSLGMHLLLASQRLEEGRLRGLDSHLSYRICLRTFSPQESRTAIGTPDAYQLPPVPGSGYLKVDTSVYRRFRCALISGPDPDPGRGPVRPRITRFTGRAVPAVPDPCVDPAPNHRAPDNEEPIQQRPTQLAVAVDRLARDGNRRSHQVWLPPLPAVLILDRLLLPPAQVDGRGLQAAAGDQLGALQAPIGLIDDPTEQAQYPLVADFGAAGHLAVVGAPQSGKTTLLRTLLTSLVLTHTPAEAQAYVIDYGGGALRALAAAPHVGVVADRSDPDLVRRVVHHVHGLLDRREAFLRDHTLDAIAGYRTARRDGEAGDGYGDVFLVIDNWTALRAEQDDLEPGVADLAARGAGAGIHLVLTAARWADIRPPILDAVSRRLELRLNDPFDSAADRHAAAALTGAPAGRGLQLPAGLPFHTASLPGDALTAVLQAAAQAWTGPAAPGVPVLPDTVTLGELPAAAGPGIPIGLEENQLSTVGVDLGGLDPHFLVLGDGESGKTSLLRTVIAGLTGRFSPSQAMILAGDARRSLLGAVPDQFRWAYAGDPAALAAAATELVAGLIDRLPPADITPDALRARSWWTGPEFYVLVDDYDLLTGAGDSPLAPLAPLLAYGHDIGLHLLLARRVTGFDRAAFEPVIARLTDLATPGLLLSGDPHEGPVLAGHRAQPAPPGRGLLIHRRRQPVRIQVALPRAPADGAAPAAANPAPAAANAAPAVVLASGSRP